jgi:hypothetical protein
MDEENSPKSINDAEATLPISYQLGDRIFKTDLYLENYIVKIEIYKPKDKLRKPTVKTINRIFRKIGEVRVRPTSDLDDDSQD